MYISQVNIPTFYLTQRGCVVHELQKIDMTILRRQVRKALFKELKTRHSTQGESSRGTKSMKLRPLLNLAATIIPETDAASLSEIVTAALDSLLRDGKVIKTGKSFCYNPDWRATESGANEDTVTSREEKSMDFPAPTVCAVEQPSSSVYPAGANTILLFYEYCRPLMTRSEQDGAILFCRSLLSANGVTGRLRIGREVKSVRRDCLIDFFIHSIYSVFFIPPFFFNFLTGVQRHTHRTDPWGASIYLGSAGNLPPPLIICVTPFQQAEYPAVFGATDFKYVDGQSDRQLLKGLKVIDYSLFTDSLSFVFHNSCP
jgi:hypothetical protein